MTTRFASQFKRTGSPNLIRQFGESVTYYPSGSSTGRVIEGMVERGFENQYVIRVRNSSTQGISSSEIDTGGDEISFPLRVGETATRRSIVKLLDGANGLTRVLCE